MIQEIVAIYLRTKVHIIAALKFAGGHVETLQGDPGAVRLGARFTINGEEWDVSVASAKILESLWEELVVGLRRETEVQFAAWEKELRTQPAKT